VRSTKPTKKPTNNLIKVEELIPAAVFKYLVYLENPILKRC